MLLIKRDFFFINNLYLIISFIMMEISYILFYSIYFFILFNHYLSIFIKSFRILIIDLFFMGFFIHFYFLIINVETNNVLNTLVFLFIFL